MCDCVISTLPPHSCITIRKLGFAGFNLKSTTLRVGETVSRCCSLLSNLRNSDSSSFRNGELQFDSSGCSCSGAETNLARSKNSTKAGRHSSAIGSDEYELHGDLGFKEGEKKQIKFEARRNGKDEPDNSIAKMGIDIGNGTNVGSRSIGTMASSSVDFLEFNGKSGKGNAGRLKDEYFLRIEEGSDGVGSQSEEMERRNVGPVLRNGREMMRRSNMIAKQVIIVQSAMSLGFVSQLWVDANSWAVMVVEVRPNLLSGELERFLLQDVRQVGDVVLIEDENATENEFKMAGLETLVGYNVVTPGRQNIGKVRGYTYNINSGAVELLELDSFGISLIPSSLVSTYGLFVEDVLEVVSDTVVVHEAAASRIQRLTKAFWDGQNVGYSTDELGEYSDFERQPVQSDHGRRRRRSFTCPKFRPKMRETADDWELPMDYF